MCLFRKISDVSVMTFIQPLSRFEMGIFSEENHQSLSQQQFSHGTRKTCGCDCQCSRTHNLLFNWKLGRFHVFLEALNMKYVHEFCNNNREENILERMPCCSMSDCSVFIYNFQLRFGVNWYRWIFIVVQTIRKKIEFVRHIICFRRPIFIRSVRKNEKDVFLWIL